MSEGRPRFVVDTNVIVSAAWREGSIPDAALGRVLEIGTLVVDARILAEYRAVLGRKKLSRIPEERRDALLAHIDRVCERLVDVARYEGDLPDPDDRPFVEVALAGKAEAVVTGNLRDYPIGLGFDVLPPALVLARLS